ncbi:hypothetical protein CONPUDRAFT_138947 [Coniophora puteana RWD-64-598 SS2]|uniref:Uncharacterized protein n=1 Tax=Coniophora puteana (strain RWD-64-598) TaxID=741705 RepID=A0A5M3MG28_CONPW|nr:uncharacterized protein CONPUDRAFT_138947 [Coniophora puteana RWD-64-598 SS2]EIW77714.1 hypothetical protein CONPUDRAFT_138947 [Coniophora puteana RWD-64-598 SS2]
MTNVSRRNRWAGMEHGGGATSQITPSAGGSGSSTANGTQQQPQQQQQQPSATWTEPPWCGWIETTGDALLILEAARRGLIPRVTRRLVDSERKMITSGSVFVFDEDESGIKRWTDGFFWSPSRILGNFLIYRETDKRGAGHRGVRAPPDPTPEGSQPEHSQYNVDGVRLEGQTLSRPKGENSGMGLDRHRERTLVGSLTNSYKFKSDGLMKKTFSLTIGGVSQHLISYYKVEDVEQGRLRSPSSLPELASLDISPEYLDKTHFRNPPKVEIGVDGIPRYRGEADDVDSGIVQPPLLAGPLASGLPLLTDGRAPANSRSRYMPYGATTPSSSKRARKGKAPAGNPGSDGSGSALSPTDAHAPSLPSPTSPVPGGPPHGFPGEPGVPGQYAASYPPMPGWPSVPGYPHPSHYPPSPYGTPAPPPLHGSSPPPHSHSQSPPTAYAYPPYGNGGGDPATASTSGQPGILGTSPPPPGGPGQPGFYPYYGPPPHAHAYGSWPPYGGSCGPDGGRRQGWR